MALGLAACGGIPAGAASITVGSGGGYDFDTIQAGIDAAVAYDTVIVADGTYGGNLDFKGKAITVKSENGAATCIIDCGGNGRGFDFYSGEGAASVLKGFTITNGSVSDTRDNGGGIRCVDYSSPVISHCIIEDNYAERGGGGIYCSESSPVITDCIIRRNRCAERGEGGGGIMCRSFSLPVITNCKIIDNESVRVAGGIYCYYYSAATISNCMICDNTSIGAGGGIVCYLSSNIALLNCTIADNWAEFPGVPTTGGGLFIVDSEVFLTNCIVWGNTSSGEGPQLSIFGSAHYPTSATVEHCDVQGGEADVWVYYMYSELYWGSGNIESAPKFLSVDDYHLQPWSPCIDAGSGAAGYDFEGDERGFDGDGDGIGVTDIGADEFVEGQDQDTDGDGLYDSWEVTGIDYDDDGIIDLNLPAMGADPNHRDLFVEVDRMAGAPFSQNALSKVRDAFANAPVYNPDGRRGITLHIQIDDTVPFHDSIDSDSDFMDIKDQNWGTFEERTHPNNADNILDSKKLAFRYCLFANELDPNDAVGIGEWPGNDFIVALGGLPPAMRTDHELAVTFMHELGHNLGLDEGGGDDILFKPNYVSVMNYGFSEFQDLNGDLLEPNYSSEKMDTLNESNLDERLGIVSKATPDVFAACGLFDSNGVHQGIQLVQLSMKPYDWNDNGDYNEPNVVVDLTCLDPCNPDSGPTPGDVLEGHDDWVNLQLAIGTTGAFRDRVVANLETTPMTVEMRQWLRDQVPHIPMLGDLNDDRRIDFSDFAALAVYWQQSGCDTCGGADLTGDADVNHLDLSVLAQRWLKGTR